MAEVSGVRVVQYAADINGMWCWEKAGSGAMAGRAVASRWPLLPTQEQSRDSSIHTQSVRALLMIEVTLLRHRHDTTPDHICVHALLVWRQIYLIGVGET